MAATNFDTSRVRLGDLVAAISGLVLFLSLFFNWYSVSVSVAGFSQSEGFSGWTVLSFIDILLFIIALVAVGVAVARMAGAMPRAAVSPGLLVLALGVLAVLLVLFRIIDIPGGGDVADVPGVDLGRSFGIFLSLLASLGVAAGGWLLWNEEGKPRPGAVTGGAATPVGAGPAGGGGGYGQAATPPASTGPATPAAASPAASAPAAAPAGAGSGGVDAPPAGGAADWYPDPRGEKRLRYWDGSQWTHHTAD
jgi:hypothetical protein